MTQLKSFQHLIMDRKFLLIFIRTLECECMFVMCEMCDVWEVGDVWEVLNVCCMCVCYV